MQVCSKRAKSVVCARVQRQGTPGIHRLSGSSVREEERGESAVGVVAGRASYGGSGK